MKTLRHTVLFFLTIAGVLLTSRVAEAQRIRDLARVKGIQPHHLTGIGLVVGLPQTGDGQQNELKKKYFLNLIRNLGAQFQLSPSDLRSRNTALVIVSATVPSTLKVGSEFDVTVSSLGDAASLRGGHLLAVPLRGPGGAEKEAGKDASPYFALAQGNIFVDREGETKATLGRSSAVMVAPFEEDPFTATADSITVLLLEPDFGTASRIATRINRNELFREPERPADGEPLAVAVDSSAVKVRVPNHFLRERTVDFISRVLELEVPNTEGEALISINRQTGAVVVNGSVRVAASAMVTYKGVMVRVPETPKPGAPPAADLERNPLLIDVVGELKNAAFTSQDIANILRELHRTRAVMGRLVER